MRTALLLFVVRVLILGSFPALIVAQEGDKPSNPPLTGPETEKRFPPLKVPPGFKATLFACDPLIEYPSVMSAGPRPGAVFVAVDYMTGLGTEITRRSEVRLVEDTNGDGYADKATLYAGGFNSIMGLTYNHGTVFVMHAPFLTALRDTKGTGVADERKDIVTGLGLTPEENPVRLHCANGVTAGHDGWLYLALGDHGCIVNRPEGDKLVLEGGGILRCRPDGRDLHIFSTGLRNIYDVALDAELNVFTRDNENDGGDYKIRVCHSFFGADHGYPYLYYERPQEALPPIADLGLGSSAGGVCYLETQFPKEYHGNLFFCEWGKSLVRYPLKRRGSSFAKPEEIECVASAENDPYGLKPTDVVVQHDGSIMISDYADGQRPKRGRGRIYHIAHADGKATTRPHDPDFTKEDRARLFHQLDSESYTARCEAQAALERQGEESARPLAEALLGGKLLGDRARLHAVWALAHLRRWDAVDHLLRVAANDPQPGVRVQAVRAMADIADPVLVRHRLDAKLGDRTLTAELAELAKGQEPRVLLELVIALSRLRWTGMGDWLQAHLRKPDSHLSHAAIQALRKTDNWPTVVKLLDLPASEPLRAIALTAIAEQFQPVVVDTLIERLKTEKDPTRGREYADALIRVYKKPAPWVYWDYRPKPRPANTVAWERTAAIGVALDKMLLDSEGSVRVAVLKKMQREKIPAGLAALGKWLEEERDSESVTLLLAALRDHPAGDIRSHLATIIREPKQSDANRLLAVDIFVQGPAGPTADEFLALAKGLWDGPILAALLKHSASVAKAAAIPLLQTKLTSPQTTVRAAAIEQLGELQAMEGRLALSKLLADENSLVRRSAAIAAGKLAETRAIDPLLKLAADSDPLVRAASLDSLRILKEPRVLPLAVAALAAPETQQMALQCLRELGSPEPAAAVVDLAKRSPSTAVLNSAVQTLTQWRERPGIAAVKQQELDKGVADIQGVTGSVVRWHSSSRYLYATGTEGRVTLVAKSPPLAYYVAETSLFVAEPSAVEFLASSSGPLEVQLAGKTIHKRDKTQEYRVDSDRFTATLAAGENRLTVLLGSSLATPGEFQLRFRRKSATEAHEKLIAAALSRGGNVEQGRSVFLNTEKSLCLKCHQVEDKGEKTGPELTGLGSRFSRIYIAESIFDPNRTIAPSFGTLIVRLENGQVITGIKIVETESVFTLVDNLAQKHIIAKADIEEQKASPLSTMPEGLEKKLTESEFVDLVAYLASLKETKP